MFAKHTENFVDDSKLNHKWRKDMTVPHEDMLAKTRVKNLSYHKICNFSKSPGRGGLFLEDRITHDGCGYVRQTGISSNVTADKGNFERKKRFVGP